MESPNFWFKPAEGQSTENRTATLGDRTNTPVYVYTGDIIRAVNVAGATGRPLLVDGPSGCGKSSLARHIAHQMDWDLEFLAVTSRTQASDLLYTADLVERLRDKDSRPWGDYLTPGVLWKAFDPEGAKNKASTERTEEPAATFALPQRGKKHGCVVLIDEIDKADPDVPNNLLVPIGSYQFTVPELEIMVHAHRHAFIVMTTNNERRLPDAFLRRCIHVTVPSLDAASLKKVARAHYPSTPALADDRLDAVIAKLAPNGGTLPDGVSTAEFLDAIEACVSLNVHPDSPDWEWINRLAASKPTRRQEL